MILNAQRKIVSQRTLGLEIPFRTKPSLLRLFMSTTSRVDCMGRLAHRPGIHSSQLKGWSAADLYLVWNRFDQRARDDLPKVVRSSRCTASIQPPSVPHRTLLWGNHRSRPFVCPGRSGIGGIKFVTGICRGGRIFGEIHDSFLI